MMKRRLRIQELRQGPKWAEIRDLLSEWDDRHWHDCAEAGCGDWNWDDWYGGIRHHLEGWTNSLSLV